jgi:hypothetical protein
MDIVPTTDGGNQSSFPNATYAERYTDEVGGAQEWDFYNITTNNGRSYFGYDSDAAGLVVFSSPVIDIPPVVGYGTNWSYTINQGSEIVRIQETVSAAVDAFGTIILPQLGQFQAVRVNLLNTQQEYLGSEPYGSAVYFREFYWLVPGIGKAVDIISTDSTTIPPANFSSVYELRRVFEASSTTNTPPEPVSNLSLSLQNGEATLNWLQATNASDYQVQALGDLIATNWQIMASPTSNSWSESVTSTQRFYRVFIEP